MGISIEADIKSSLDSLELNLVLTNEVTLVHQKQVLFNVIVEKHRKVFIKRQKRINALKGPFIKVRGVLAGILGENIESINSEEIIDTSGHDEEKRRTRIIMDSLSYKKSLEYFIDTKRIGLDRTNKVWKKNSI